MPAPGILDPQFSPVGRYLIDTNARKLSLAANEVPLFHDTQNFKEECQIGGPTTNHSRFDNRAWAIQRGFQPCPHCKEN